MKICSIRHRGLQRLIQDDDPRRLPPDLLPRIRAVLTALILATGMGEFIDHSPQGWHIHRLRGKRRNEWSVWVSANQRITFEEYDGYIKRLNLGDYH